MNFNTFLRWLTRSWNHYPLLPKSLLNKANTLVSCSQSIQIACTAKMAYQMKSSHLSTTIWVHLHTLAVTVPCFKCLVSVSSRALLPCGCGGLHTLVNALESEWRHWSLEIGSNQQQLDVILLEFKFTWFLFTCLDDLGVLFFLWINLAIKYLMQLWVLQPFVRLLDF